MQPPRRILKILPPAALTIVLVAVYLATLAPGLTWANSGADGGDLITAAATGGVAHPTGYPTYLLLARLFQFIPVGSLAFRTNLMSAVAAALTALLVYHITTRSLSSDQPHRYWLAGLAAGLGAGLAPLLWSQAVITEVYAMNALFVALILFLSESPLTDHFTGLRRAGLLGLVFGLALGNHVTVAFLFPILLLSTISWKSHPVEAKRSLRLNGRVFLWMLLGMLAGLLVYLSLPLRALSNPPVNWGDPVTPGGFAWLVSGKLYQHELLLLSFPLMAERLRALASIFLDGFGVVGLTLGLVGLIVFFRPGRLYYSLLWMTAAFSAFSVLYSTNDSFVYLIPVVLCFSIWLGIGVGRSMDGLAGRWNYFPTLTGGVILLILLVQAGLHWSQVDASKDTRADTFATTFLSAAPADAIVFASGDQAIFALWYYHYALHDRPDLAVIASDLLQFDWYLQTLRATYPAMDLSEPFPFPETVIVLNPDRPVCYVQYDQAPEVSCLPPRRMATP